MATNRCGGVEHRVFSPRRISLKTRLVESSTRRENPREEPLPSSLSPSPPRGTKSGSLVNARGNAKRAKSCAPRAGGGGGNDTIRFCRRQSSCRLITTPLASPSRPSPPSSRSQTPGTNATEWLSQAGTSVKSHLPWPLTSRQWFRRRAASRVRRESFRDSSKTTASISVKLAISDQDLINSIVEVGFFGRTKFREFLDFGCRERRKERSF